MMRRLRSIADTNGEASIRRNIAERIGEGTTMKKDRVELFGNKIAVQVSAFFLCACQLPILERSYKAQW